MSICWRSYFRAKQEQADCNIPQLAERYFFQEGIPWALVGRAWGQLLRLPLGPCPDRGHSRYSGGDTSKGQTQREPVCSLRHWQSEASRKKASVGNLYVTVSLTGATGKWLGFFCPHLIWCNDYSRRGAGRLPVPAHAGAQLLGALSQQQA